MVILAEGGLGPTFRKFARQGNVHFISEYIILRLATFEVFEQRPDNPVSVAIQLYLAAG